MEGDKTRFHLGSNIGNLCTRCIVLVLQAGEKWARSSEDFGTVKNDIKFDLSNSRCGRY